MLKYANATKTAASFNGAFFSLSAPEDLNSIGDGPTRDAVLKWLAAGNTPTPLSLPTLTEVKATKIAILESSRRQAVDTLPPVTVAGKQYPANSEYRELVSGMARRSAAGKLIPVTLRGADGVAVTLTAILLGQIDDAIAAIVQAQWTAYWTKFDAVQAAVTQDAVDAVTW